MRGHRGIVQRKSESSERGNDGVFVDLYATEQKGVGVLGPNAVLEQRRFRKIAKVAGHDKFRSTMYRGGEHMAIIRVRQRKRSNSIFISRDERVLKMFIHQPSRARQSLERNVGTITRERGHPLIVNPARPTRSKDAMRRES